MTSFSTSTMSESSQANSAISTLVVGLRANLSGYYNHMTNVTEWQNFYFDDANSFTYVSMTNMKKNYYGIELGLDFKLTSFLNFKALGTWSEAKTLTMLMLST